MIEPDDLERRLRSAVPNSPEPPDLAPAAADAGLLDVAFATLESPLGTLLLAATPQGLVRLAYLDGAGDEAFALAELARRVSPRILAAPRRLDQPRRELDEYLTGRRDRFAIALDERLMSPFGRRVLTAAAAIPYGTVATYGAVAAQAGSPRGARAAGNALGANPLPIVLPCHRVVHADGGLGGYTGGLARKRTLLAIEAGRT
jgi:methylated-DNA-[protein]-cysteine S-methyltransferase